ncbi:hypothetical protein GCM10010517_54460 [Streptosporangium fragile]|uniref:Peptidase S33 tripeptidyl aminopeptidase-like C-terminal domain-containing protein n=1 Tax=Streptosporangium fragile TaxID=46186 RepID=A0ABN3W4M1_9ACTN
MRSSSPREGRTPRCGVAGTARRSEAGPATALSGRRAAHRALTGFRPVTPRGAFRHPVHAGLSAPRNARVDNAVNRCLVDGVLPAEDTACPATPSTGRG